MIKEILLAAFGAAGFAILFGMKRSRLWIIFLASGLSWCGYLELCRILKDEISAMFFITVFVVLFAQIITLFVEGPVILFSIPILIPFIPGATLYYVMEDLVSESYKLATDIRLLVRQVGAMALGILVAEMFRIVVKNKRRKFRLNCYTKVCNRNKLALKNRDV